MCLNELHVFYSALKIFYILLIILEFLVFRTVYLIRFLIIAMNLGVAGAALPLLFSTFTQASLQTTQQLVMRDYTPTYLKIINNFITTTKKFPKLPSEAYSMIKRLGILRHRCGTTSGFQVKHRHLETFHIPTGISYERLSKADKRGTNLHNMCPL